MRIGTRQTSGSDLVARMMCWPVKRGSEPMVQGHSSLTGIGWAQVFLSVDRLSRIGRVSLTSVRPCGYQISIAGLLRR